MSARLLDIARVAAGRARGSEQVEAYVVRSQETDVRAFGGDVESLSVAEVEGVGVRVVADRRQGFAWAGSLEASIVAQTVDEARDNATFSQADEWNGLPGSDDFAQAPPDLEVWRDEVLATPVAEKVALTLELERATRDADARVRGVEVAAYHDGAVEAALTSSLGVEVTTSRTQCACSTLALAGEREETQTGYGFSVGRAPSDLDVGTAASEAAERAVRLLGATQPRTRRLPIVLDPLVTRAVLSVVGAALNGEAVLKGRSMFVDRQGDDVAAPVVTLVDDPTLPDAPGAISYDAEGVPTRRTELITGGRLGALLHNTYTARRAGGRTTASAVRAGFKSAPGVGARALHVVPGDATPREILRHAPEALYVQQVTGLHSGTNPVSGDFSVGAEGLMVRDGELAEPVREITIASTLQRLLLDVAKVGSDLTWRPDGGAGVTVLVHEMTMSGR